MLPKTRAYVKSYDGQTKWMYFLTEDDEILEKQYSLLSISGTSTGPKKMVPLIECFTYPNCSVSGTSMKPKKKFQLSNFSPI